MNNVFIGFIFIMFDFTLNLGNSSISLIPSFIGYWFLAKGLKELEGESAKCGNMIPWSTGMMIFTAITWVLDAIGISGQLGFIGTIVGIVGTVLSIYISYQVVMGIKEVEDYHRVDIMADKVKSSWFAYMIATVAAMVVVWIPVINIIAVVAAFICDVLFVVAVNNTKKAYYMLPPVTTFTSDSEDGI